MSPTLTVGVRTILTSFDDFADEAPNPISDDERSDSPEKDVARSLSSKCRHCVQRAAVFADDAAIASIPDHFREAATQHHNFVCASLIKARVLIRRNRDRSLKSRRGLSF